MYKYNSAKLKHYPKMIYICLFIIQLSFYSCYDTCSKNVIKSAGDTITNVSFYHHKNGSFIRFDGVINDSINTSFDFDSGLTGWDMKIDSAFFFNHFDVSQFKQEKKPFKLTFYRETFVGRLIISISNHKFEVERLLVENLHDPNREGSCGVVGSKMLENKITIFDFEKRQVAFLDSITVDESYEKVKFLPRRDKAIINNQKYIEIGGLNNNIGEPMLLLLLFDTGSVTSSIALNNKIGAQISNQIQKKETVTSIGSYRVPTAQIKGFVDSLTIGSFPLYNATVRYSSQSGIADQMGDGSISDGLLGLPFLVRFSLIVDYKSNFMYIKPNLYQKTGATYKWDATQDSIYLVNVNKKSLEK